MSSKLDILREYNEDIQLINANEFKNINASLIPDLWVEVFSEHNRKENQENFKYMEKICR